MKTLGHAPTELVVYPGEDQGFTTPSHIKDRLERYIAWYAHYVKSDSSPRVHPINLRQPRSPPTSAFLRFP